MNDAFEGGTGAEFLGCLFCKSGKEAEAVQRFEGLYPGASAIAPVKTRYRRAGGVAKEERVPVLPGYVFFRAADGLSIASLRQIDSVLKLLTYDDGDWRLHGDDARFAEMMFREHGEIGISKAYYDEGDRIRILEGFMKAYEGSIIRVNRRAKTAEIRIAFQEKQISMWLGFELIEKAGQE